MRCLVAVESPAAGSIVLNLKRAYPDWVFDICSNAEELRNVSRTEGVDVLMLSRFFPGEEPLELIKYIPSLYHRSHIVLLVGAINEQAKAYIRAAEKSGLKNVVTGKLPGDRPYTIFAAISHAREIMLELEDEQLPTYYEPESLVVERRVEPMPEAVVFEEDVITPPGLRQRLSFTEEEPPEPVITQPTPVAVTRERLPDRGSRQVAPDSNYFQPTRAKGKLILICSNKGGVGKTTVSIGLAQELARGSIVPVSEYCPTSP